VLPIKFSREIIGFLLPLIIFFSLEGAAQSNTLAAAVYSRLDNSPIEYVAIGIKGSREGTFSNARGQFTITCQSGDSLIISAIGYKKKTCDCRKEKIYLDTSAVRLEEVIIRPSGKSIRRNLGYFNKKRAGAFTGFSAVLCFIENKNKERCLLSKANFLLSKVRWLDGPPETAFHQLLVRLLIYHVKPYTDEPGLLILTKNITENVEPVQRKVSFDISGLGLDFPLEGILIGIEFLGYTADGEFTPFSSKDKNKFLQYKAGMTKAEGRARGWLRDNYSDQWIPISRGIQPEHNPNFGLEVICEKQRSFRKRKEAEGIPSVPRRNKAQATSRY